MSRIGQLIELKALRAEVEELRRFINAQRENNSILLKHMTQHQARIEALEAKRGPGRPKNERLTASGD